MMKTVYRNVLVRLPAGQRDNERRPLPRRAFCCDAAAVPFDYFFADGKTNARPIILAGSAVKPLERGKNFVEVLLFKPDSVVFDANLKIFIINRGAVQINNRLLPLLVKFESIADQILE